VPVVDTQKPLLSSVGSGWRCLLLATASYW